MLLDFFMLTRCIPVGEEGPNENAKDVGRRKARFVLSRCLEGNRKERKPTTPSDFHF